MGWYEKQRREELREAKARHAGYVQQDGDKILSISAAQQDKEDLILIGQDFANQLRLMANKLQKALIAPALEKQADYGNRRNGKSRTPTIEEMCEAGADTAISRYAYDIMRSAAAIYSKAEDIMAVNGSADSLEAGKQQVLQEIRETMARKPAGLITGEDLLKAKRGK